MRIQSVILLSVFFLLLPVSFLISQESSSNLKSELQNKEAQFYKIKSKLDSLENEYNKVSILYEQYKQTRITLSNLYKKSKDAYERGSKNIDIITSKDLASLLDDYKNKDKQYTQIKYREKEAESNKNKIETEIQLYTKLHNQKEIELLKLKASIYEKEMRKPIWAIGNGESILDENKTIQECKKLALEYAKKDASEKAKGILIETMTSYEQSEVYIDTIKDKKLDQERINRNSKYHEKFIDIIKTSSNVQILEQDVTGNYGKVRRVDQGDVIKFVATVRLKLINISSYNPYFKKINLINEKLQKHTLFEDNFDIEFSKSKIWKVENYENLTTIIQQNGQLFFSDYSDKPIYAHFITKPIKPRDFWVAIDIKIGKMNKGNAHLVLDNTFEGDLHRSFHIQFEQTATNGQWRSLLKSKTNNWRPTTKNNVIPKFGDENEKYHTMKIVYDHNNRTALAYVDDIYLGEEYINWDLSKGIRISFLVWNGGASFGNGKTEVYFDNFRTNIPLEEVLR